MEDEKKPGITVDLPTYKRLHKAYVKAYTEAYGPSGRARDTVLMIDGQEVLLGYLYYVLEYMETRSGSIAEYARKNKIERSR